MENSIESFECLGCGVYCRIPNGMVGTSKDEMSRIAAFLGLTEEDFMADEIEMDMDGTGLILKNRADDACVWL